MLNIKKFSICFLLVLGTFSTRGQTFQGYIIAGANASQLNGDLLAGYDKLGLHGGLRVSAELTDRVIGSVELLFSQRGSKSDFFNSAGQNSIHLNYVELPLLVGYRDWLKEDYYKMLFEAGFSYGRLFSNRVRIPGLTDRAADFQKNDVSYLLGATFFSSPRFGYSFRYTNSINFLLNDQISTDLGRLRGYFLTFRFLYQL